MAKKLGLNVSFGLNTKDFSTKMQNVRREMAQTSKKFSSIGKNMTAAVTLPIVGMGIAAVKAASDMESLQVRLNTAFKGNETAAKKAFAEINKFTASTPFQLEEVAGAFVKLKNMGLDPSISALRSYGNTASSMGKSLDQMVEAVADAATGEFERLKEFGIKANKEGDRVKFMFRGVTTEVGFNSKEIQKYLLNIGNTEFAGGIEKQSKTFAGRMSTLRDNAKLMAASFGELLLPVMNKIVKALTKAASIVNGMTPAWKKFTVVSSGLAAAIGPLALVIGKVVKWIPTMITGFKTIRLAMSAAAGPIGIVVGFFTTLFMVMRKGQKPQSTFTKNLIKEKTEMNGLFSVLKRTKEGTEGRVEAIRQLNKKYGQYLPNQLNEKSNLKEINKAQKAANKSLLQSIFLKSKQEDIAKAEQDAINKSRGAMQNLRDVTGSATTARSMYFSKATEGEINAFTTGVVDAIARNRNSLLNVPKYGIQAVMNEVDDLAREMNLGFDSTKLKNAIIGIRNVEAERYIQIKKINEEYKTTAKLLGVSELSAVADDDDVVDDEVVEGGGGNGGAKETKRRGGIIEPMQGIGLSGLATTMERDTPKIVSYISKVGESLEGLQYKTQMATASWMEFTTKMKDTAKSMIVPALETIGYELGRALGQGGFKNGELGKALIDQIMQFASQLGTQLIAIGSALMLAPGMQGAGQGYITAGALLKVGAAVHRGFVQASMSQDVTGGTSATGVAANGQKIELTGQIRGDHLVILSSDYQRRGR